MLTHFECGFTPSPAIHYSIPVSYYSIITAFVLFDLEILLFIPMIYLGITSYIIPLFIIITLYIEIRCQY
jgi:NADH:ubiquinone oxidoreductase subunit 3 (subunit A)